MSVALVWSCFCFYSLLTKVNGNDLERWAWVGWCGWKSFRSVLVYVFAVPHCEPRVPRVWRGIREGNPRKKDGVGIELEFVDHCPLVLSCVLPTRTLC